MCVGGLLTKDAEHRVLNGLEPHQTRLRNETGNREPFPICRSPQVTCGPYLPDAQDWEGAGDKVKGKRGKKKKKQGRKRVKGEGRMEKGEKKRGKGRRRRKKKAEQKES